MFGRFNNGTDIRAPEPVRGTPGSVGYDLYITKEKEYVNGVHYFHTGWSVQPPSGYYATIHPRSSLSKNGFILANSTGIIDVDYEGELIVALISHNNSPVPQLPFKAVQVIFNPLPYMGDIKYVDEIPKKNTQRGEGGFGSTGN